MKNIDDEEYGYNDNNPLLLVDYYYIINHKHEMSKIEYISLSTNIFTNGTYETKIDSATGFIKIFNVTNADYLIYLDKDQNIILYLYANISSILNKTVVDDIKAISKTIVNKKKPDAVSLSSENFLQNNGLIDLNNLVCSECDSSEFKTPVICSDGITLELQCAKCYTIYRIAPSRYYRILSKTLFASNSQSKPKIDLRKLYNNVEREDTNVR